MSENTPNPQIANAPATPSANLPEDVMQAIQAQNPQRLFEACSRHYEPQVVAMWSGDPGRGAAILGFLPKLGEMHTIMNAFCSVYYDINTSKQVTVYMGLDDLVKIQFTCMSGVLARALQAVSPEVGQRAMGQLAGVSRVLAVAGLVQSNTAS